MEDVERGLKHVVSPFPSKHIVVSQVIGHNSVQKSMDIRVVVPRRKPAIEQIIDVFVKKLKINHVEVIHDKVIVRGNFEIKAIYVACLPNQPVHAVEVQHVRFTVDVPIRGARPGMDAEANVAVEYVDYDCDRRSSAYWYKQYEKQLRLYYDEDDYDDYDEDFYHFGKQHKKHGHDWDHHHDPCSPEGHMPCKPHKPVKPCHPHWEPCPPKKKCARRFNVAVVLRVAAKVMCDRPVIIQPGFPVHPGFPMQPTLPPKPKG